jgi:hypothetical protein
VEPLVEQVEQEPLGHPLQLQVPQQVLQQLQLQQLQLLPQPWQLW